MEINIHSKDHKDYLDFVVNGLKKFGKAQNCIAKIDVFHSSISVTYKNNIENFTEMLSVHENIKNHGLETHISIADMRNGNKISYKLED